MYTYTKEIVEGINTMTAFTADQLALQAHIEASNAKHVARAEAEGWTFYTTTVSDPAHWARVDVFTIEQYERESLISYISDAHKDAYGFRPRGYNYAEWSLAQLEAEADRLSDAVTNAIREREFDEAREVEALEVKIADLMDMGARDRKTAIRWICDSINHGGDLSYVCYELGVPYSMVDEFKEAVA
jgi:hypothetical protein